MNLREEISPIDGILHSENVNLLQAALASTTFDQLRQLAPGIWSDDDVYDRVDSGSLVPKTTIVYNTRQRSILYILNGMIGYDKVNACLTGWDNINAGNDHRTYPYGSAAAQLLLTTYVPGGNPSWLKVRVIGHSYGGAVAPFLAGGLRYTDQSTGFGIYTYGAPKPSIARTWRQDLDAKHLRVFLNTDPVPLLPLGYEDLQQLWAFVGVPLARRWNQWQQFVSGLYVNSSNRMVIGGQPAYQPSAERLWTLANWMTGNRAFGSDAHTLDAYARAMAVVPAVTAPNPEPAAYGTGRGHTYTPAARFEEERVIQMIAMGADTQADPMAAVQQIQQNVVLIPNTKYHGRLASGQHVITYNTDIVGVTRTLRLRRAIVRRLNRNLKSL